MSSLVIFLDGLCVTAGMLGVTALSASPPIDSWPDLLLLLAKSLLVATCCIVAFYYTDLYNFRVLRSTTDLLARLPQSLGIAFILLAVSYILLPGLVIAGRPLMLGLLSVPLLVVPLRVILFASFRSKTLAERVLVLGTSPLARQIVSAIESQPHLRLAIVGIADDTAVAAEAPFSRYLRLGPIERLGKIIEEVAPDRIVVGLSERRRQLPLGDLLDARMRGVIVEDAMAAYERLTGKLAVESLMPSFLIFSPDFTKSRVQVGIRRLVSLASATVGLILSLPLVLLIVIAIKLDSRGPVFFVQERAGLNGHPFRLFKFRTMRPQDQGQESIASPDVWNRDDSGRITRVGQLLRKLRLDELPQFWNILRGDMDVIGPRPEIASNIREMSDRIPYYSLRCAIRPGVTGWAQIRHGYSVSLEDVTEKIRYDLYYVKHMSLWLDLQILIDTVKIVLFGRGAR